MRQTSTSILRIRRHHLGASRQRRLSTQAHLPGAVAGAVSFVIAVSLGAPMTDAAPPRFVPVQMGPSDPSPSSEMQSIRLGAGQVISFDQVAGQPGWKDRARARLENGVWVFNSDGTFLFSTTDVRTDVYPLRGRFQVQGDKLLFAAQSASQVGGSGASVEMQGSIDLSLDPPVMHVMWASGAGYGAVVNEQRFGSNASSAYAARLTIVPR